MAAPKHNDSHCQDYIRQLSEYIDGELPPDLCAKLEEHMAGCENCTVVVNTLKRTIDLYQQTEAEQPLTAEAKKRLFARLSLDDLLK
jgi:Predicted transmembrane transcriptional regulator (anti-sigma factor)